MNIISKKAFVEFWKKNPRSKAALESWYKTAKKAQWKNIVEARNDFPHADLAGVCTVFNISGNKCRLIVKISYRTQKIFVRAILTHAEYDKGTYQKDCES